MEDEFDVNFFRITKDGLTVPPKTTFQDDVTFLGNVFGLPSGGSGSGSFVLDGGDPFTDYSSGPSFDCGGV